MKNKIITVVLLVFIGAILMFFYGNGKTTNLPPTPENVATTSTNLTQSGKIDEHLTINNELRDVNFCGKKYKTKQVFLDGTDVVQRIAEIITEMNGESNEKKQFAIAICENIKFRITTGNLDELEISGPAIRNNDYSKYYMGIGRFLIFTINYPGLQIEVSKAEEGSSIVIGLLK